MLCWCGRFLLIAIYNVYDFDWVVIYDMYDYNSILIADLLEGKELVWHDDMVITDVKYELSLWCANIHGWFWLFKPIRVWIIFAIWTGQTKTVWVNLVWFVGLFVLSNRVWPNFDDVTRITTMSGSGCAWWFLSDTVRPLAHHTSIARAA